MTVRAVSLEVRRTARIWQAGSDGARRVWFVLHGYGQSAREALEAVEPVADPEVRIVAPEGLSRFYRRGLAGSVGASWMTSDDRECEISDYLDYLDRACDALLPSGGAPTGVVGFSQGGATATRWFVRAARPLARLILFGSDVPEDVDDARLLQRLGASPLDLAVGLEDPFFAGDRLDRVLRNLEERGLPARLSRFDGEHRLDADTFRRLMHGSQRQAPQTS